MISSALLPIPAAAFTPATSYFLACGSSSAVDNPPRSFVPDSPFLSHSNSLSLSSSSSSSNPLYTTARLFTAPTTYTFPAKSSAQNYILRLHFFPFSTPSLDLSTASFNVSALGRFALLTNFSLPPSSPAVIKEFLLPAIAATDHLMITLTFTPNPSSAFVNAIELFDAPSNLIDGASPAYVGAPGSLIKPSLDQGMETLYRVNVGGPLVTPANDTLWRTWLPDDPYMFDGSSSLSFKNSTSRPVRYRASDPRRTPEIAPEAVYATARTMAVTPLLLTSNPNFNFNLTWSFRVTPGRTYFLRMHFCDFLFSPAAQLYFDVYVGPLMAYADLQPGSFTDQTPAAAFYVDFATLSDASGLLNVSIGRSNRSTPTTANALLNGLEIMKLGLDSEAQLKTRGGGASVKILIPSIIGGIIALLMSILLAVVLIRRRRRQQPKSAAAAPSCSTYRPEAAASSARGTLASEPGTRANLDLQIPFEEIRLATDGFDEKLVIGSGGFGKVYKGVLRDGTRVAVKRGMPGSRQGYPEFQTEIQVLSGIRHRHLVSLIGYCDDQSEMILVYEYMEKGPLKDYLYGSKNLPCLTWKQRLEICIGAARGLHYLHTGYSHNIIHRDIKSTNILLGEGYFAKVADFGLSRAGPSIGETHVSTGVKGTFGYLDPEYFKIQQLTDKSDVYSFGVTLFEVLCARPVIDPNQSREQLNLVEWAVLWQRRGKLEKIIDPRLAGGINANSLRKFGETAAKCVAEYGVDRPTIGDVLWNLEYALQLQEMEVRREPFEDSGSVESQVPVNVPTSRRAAPPAIDDEEEIRGSWNEGESGVSASMVFSQLFAGDGR